MRKLCRSCLCCILFVLAPLSYSQEVRAGFDGCRFGTPPARCGERHHNGYQSGYQCQSHALRETTPTDSSTPFLAPGQYKMTVDATDFLEICPRSHQFAGGRPRARVDVKLESAR
jgi:hypothetical protein